MLIIVIIKEKIAAGNVLKNFPLRKLSGYWSKDLRNEQIVIFCENI